MYTVLDNMFNAEQPPVLTQPEKVIKVGISNLRAESVVDKRQDFSFPDRVDIDDFVVIASPINTGRPSTLTRSGTEGRALAAHIGPFTDSAGNVYSDILVKGVGAREKPRIQTKEKGVHFVSPARRGKTSKEIPIRMSTTPIMGISGYYGLSNLSPALIDSYNSDLLAEKGLRTRRLILAGEYPDRKIFGTEQGILSANELAKKLGTTSAPSVEVLAIRSRYRVKDVLTLAQVNNFKLSRVQNQVFSDDINNLYALVDKDFKERLVDSGVIDIDAIATARDSLAELAKELVNRLKVDTEDSFSSIGTEFEGVDFSSIQNLQNFFGKYLSEFSNVIGMQTGIMYGAAAFTRNHMLNSQNVTLLAEIVDHDVTYFSESNKSDGKMILDQINQVYEGSLLEFATILQVVGALPSEFSFETVLHRFFDGMKEVLSSEDRKKIADSVKKAYDFNQKKIEDDGRFTDLVRVIELSRELGRDTRKYAGLVEAYKDKLIFDPIQNKWVNKDDVAGSARIYYLIDQLSKIDQSDNDDDPPPPFPPGGASPSEELPPHQQTEEENNREFNPNAEFLAFLLGENVPVSIAETLTDPENLRRPFFAAFRDFFVDAKDTLVRFPDWIKATAKYIYDAPAPVFMQREIFGILNLFYSTTDFIKATSPIAGRVILDTAILTGKIVQISSEIVIQTALLAAFISRPVIWTAFNGVKLIGMLALVLVDQRTEGMWFNRRIIRGGQARESESFLPAPDLSKLSQLSEELLESGANLANGKGWFERERSYERKQKEHSARVRMLREEAQYIAEVAGVEALPTGVRNVLYLLGDGSGYEVNERLAFRGIREYQGLLSRIGESLRIIENMGELLPQLAERQTELKLQLENSRDSIWFGEKKVKEISREITLLVRNTEREAVKIRAEQFFAEESNRIAAEAARKFAEEQMLADLLEEQADDTNEEIEYIEVIEVITGLAGPSMSAFDDATDYEPEEAGMVFASVETSPNPSLAEVGDEEIVTQLEPENARAGLGIFSQRDTTPNTSQVQGLGRRTYRRRTRDFEPIVIPEINFPAIPRPSMPKIARIKIKRPAISPGFRIPSFQRGQLQPAYAFARI